MMSSTFLFVFVILFMSFLPLNASIVSQLPIYEAFSDFLNHPISNHPSFNSCILKINSTTEAHPIKNKTQLMDLDIDAQLFILEKLSILELISVAETNQHFSLLVEDVFRRKSAKKVFEILDPRYGNFDALLETKDKVYIRQLAIISLVLKQFGHLISHLVIVYSSSNKFYVHFNAINNLSELINQYCSDSLTNFEIVNYYETFFDKMVKPFKNVKQLSIRGKFNSLGSDTLSFAELFPSIKQLKIEYVDVQNTSCIDHKFPYLERLNVEINQKRRFVENDVSKLLNKNPQISYLELSKITETFLIELSGIDLSLTQVNFNLSFDVNDETIIRFIENNGRLQKIQLIRYEMPNTFSKLAEILKQQFTDKWTMKETRYSIILERI